MTNWLKGNYFIKQVLGGMFITISMTGLDQEMMQKNISCRNLGEAQKNVITFSFILMLVNLIFLVLGGVLYLYATAENIPVPALTDNLFPVIAMHYLPGFIALVFVIGLISALFPSADGALTALTSSICIDILGINDKKELTEKNRTKTRLTVHFIMAFVFLLFVIGFKILNKQAIIDLLLKIAGYTYGPLLGLFMFGILTKRSINDKYSPVVCLAVPVVCFIADINSSKIVDGFSFGPELLLWNGLLTFAGLWLISKPHGDFGKSR
jgi:Na+/proline symporter